MYTPAPFKIDDPGLIRSFIEAYSLGLLLSTDGIDIYDTHTPFIYSDDGTHLLGHIAKANPQWKHWSNKQKVKIVFTGPHSYISPHFYTSDFAVPTWNYTAVSITGRVSIIENKNETLKFLDQLTATHETSNEPWSLDHSDQRYMKLLNGIITFSISIESIEASFKMNQNKSENDQTKVIDSLSATGCPFNQDMASLMSQTRKPSS